MVRLGRTKHDPRRRSAAAEDPGVRQHRFVLRQGPPGAVPAVPGHTVRNRSRLTRSTLALVLALVLAGACAGDRISPSRSHASTSSQAVAGRPFPDITGQTLADANAAALQKEIERWVSTGLISGVTAGVVSHGRTWSGAAGVDRTGTALTPQTGLVIASVTKTFVAAEVLRLVEEGKVQLDSPASAYVQSPLLAKGATVRQLLGMHSGIPQDVVDEIGDTTKAWTATRALAGVPLRLSEPGGNFEYVNANYWLLGLLIEQVRGVSLGAALEQGPFERAGLKRISLQSERPLPPPLAHPADDRDIPIPAKPDGYLPFHSMATYAGAAGGIAADAPTTARWGYELYGGHVLSRTMLTEMLDVSDGDDYGLGLMNFGDSPFNIEAVGHEGELVGYRSILVAFEKDQLSVALLTPSTTRTVPLVQYLVKAGDLLSH
jgi:D-alanyl-D-alanine carboxypeptidase